MRLNASVVPSLHHRKEGWMRHQEKCRAATESPQPGWFTSLSSIGKPPRPRYQRMLCDIFLARAATPPCADARRGLSPTSIHHEFHRLRRSAVSGEPRASERSERALGRFGLSEQAPLGAKDLSPLRGWSLRRFSTCHLQEPGVALSRSGS